MFEIIKYKKKVFGYLIELDLNKKGLEFYTPKNLSHQIASMSYEKKHQIKPHIHYKNIRRDINITSEVLIILDGKLRVDFYFKTKKYAFSKVINKNKILILTGEGHGFKVIKKIKMLEIKQGPYIKKRDKLLIDQIEEKSIKILK